ncbi:hypothetical protein JRC45_11855 [Escherichia albertii]|uniref:hypothetical protein n=1 Tax=Escherichia albertii TaxID=208962 RepID=UPI001ABFC08F|nr:hypothetical protein [Escherichia albertii]QST44784.1 hypothetical protein JRC45_11855 [Escherichia albertii]
MFISTAAKAEAERAISAGKTVSRTEKIFMKKSQVKNRKTPLWQLVCKTKENKMAQNVNLLG